MIRRELERSLGAFDVAIIVVGAIIGSGIFLVPGTVLRDSGGSVGLALGVWSAANPTRTSGPAVGFICVWVQSRSWTSPRSST